MGAKQNRSVRDQLGGGDRRSIGRADEVAELLIRDQRSFDEAVETLFDGEAVARARAADALEKATRVHIEFLQPHGGRLIGYLATFQQKEVRWHVAQMLPRLVLKKEELVAVVHNLMTWLEREDSRIVQVNCLQALAELAVRYSVLHRRVRSLITRYGKTGSPAVRARCRRLAIRLR